MTPRKTFLFFVLLLILIVLPSALAAIPAPGDALRDLTTFFTGLVSGSASMENAYFISFILYFIIFIAIYMEGLKQIPIFGARGELNKQGKWFAVAAAGLSTIAIFIVDNVTNVTMAERLSYLVSPWGVWGGVMIAAIMAYITFRFLHDSELFKEHIMFAMAIAAAVGVTLAGFLLTMENLIGWGFLIMLLVFLVGALFAIFGRSSGSGGGSEGDSGGGRGGDEGGTDGDGSGGDGGSDDGTGGDDGGTGGGRPPGPEPPPTPPVRKGDDPPMPAKPVAGIPPKPVGPKPKEKSKNTLPKEKEVFKDLSPFFNPIRSQDGVGACTCFAATSIGEYIFNRINGRVEKKYLSPLYVYYYARQPVGKKGVIKVENGSCPYIVSDLLVKKGSCREELWKFEAAAAGKHTHEPDDKADEDAPKQRVVTVKALSHDPTQWAYEICVNQNPILFAALWPVDALVGFKEKLYHNPTPIFIGGGSSHEVVLVGYHSHYPHNGKGIPAFKIRNSWDISWGENGYVWVPADTLKKMAFKIYSPLVLEGWQKYQQEPKKKEQEKIPEVIKGLREVEKIAASIRDCTKKKEFIINGTERKKWVNSLYKLLEKVFDGREFGPDLNKVIELLYGKPQKVLKGYKGKNLRELCEEAEEEKDQENALFLAQEVLKAINTLKER